MIYIYPWWPFIIHDQKRWYWKLLQNIGPLFFSWKKCGPKTTTSLAMSKPLPWSDPKAPKSRPVVELRKKSRPWHRRFWSLSGDDRPERRWGWFRVLLVGSKTPSQKLRNIEWQWKKQPWKCAIFYDDLKLLQKNLCGPFHFEDVFETCLSLGDRKPRTTALWLRRWHPEDSSSPRWAPENFDNERSEYFKGFMVDLWLVYGWFMVDLC